MPVTPSKRASSKTASPRRVSKVTRTQPSRPVPGKSRVPPSGKKSAARPKRSDARPGTSPAGKRASTPRTTPTGVSSTPAADPQARLQVLQARIDAIKQQLKIAKRELKTALPPGYAKLPEIRTPSVPQSPHIQVRSSGVHGKGVFATADLPKGTVLVEYVGEILSWKKAQKRHPHDPSDPNHTFFFHVDDKHVIDAAVGGNDARWINHACKPNCEPDEVDGRVFIKTLRAIKSGDELFYDYGLIIDEPYTKKLRDEYACRCGAKQCRGTMLAPKG
jgi:uncharacterized protein